MSPNLTLVSHLELFKEHFEETEDKYYIELLGRAISHIETLEKKTSYFQEFKAATIRGDTLKSHNKRLTKELADLKQKNVDRDWGIK